MTDYDSTADTQVHIDHVRSYLNEVVNELRLRASIHDASKLLDPEKAVFDEYTPKLANSTYGTDEYKSYLAGMGDGLAHHYAYNDHHPEHHAGGIHDMDLLQITEMLCDWKAATLRHADGDLNRSITQNAQRFGYGPEIEHMLRLTASRLGWIDLNPHEHRINPTDPTYNFAPPDKPTTHDHTDSFQKDFEQGRVQ